MSGKNDTGRRPFEYVVIYRDICSTAFAGTCPCEVLSAQRLEKGFGTINTCGNTDDFTRSSRADYFVSAENFQSVQIDVRRPHLAYQQTLAISTSGTYTGISAANLDDVSFAALYADGSAVKLGKFSIGTDGTMTLVGTALDVTSYGVNLICEMSSASVVLGSRFGTAAQVATFSGSTWSVSGTIYNATTAPDQIVSLGSSKVAFLNGGFGDTPSVEVATWSGTSWSTTMARTNVSGATGKSVYSACALGNGILFTSTDDTPVTAYFIDLSATPTQTGSIDVSQAPGDTHDAVVCAAINSTQALIITRSNGVLYSSIMQKKTAASALQLARMGNIGQITPDDNLSLAVVGSEAILTNGATTARTAYSLQLAPISTSTNIYPYLMSVSHTPSKINPAGSDGNSTPLGKRATLSVSLIDATSDDLHQDPYYAERISGAARYDAVGYEPDERSTFFAKYFRRNQYLWGRQLDWVTGYIQDDGSLVDSITRTFVIDGHTGPDEQGRVSISAKDVLSLTNADKAQCPKPSLGALAANISSTDTSLVLKPYGVGASYPASGKVKIGKEAISYTGKSADTLTGLTRGIDGSTAEDHQTDDTVQLAWVVVNQTPDAIINDLLSNFTTIPASMLNTAQWADEVTNRAWLNHQYSATIYEPTGVGKLMGDIARQMQFYPFVDERANDIKIAAISPVYALGDSNHQLNDTNNILADSLTVEEQNDRVITRLYIHINPINWADKLDDAKNYSATLADWSADEEDGNHRRSAKSMEVFGYWLTPTLADLLGKNVRAQFSKAPKRISFRLDGKDNQVQLSDFLTIDHRLLTDEYGLRRSVLAQAISVSETKKGTEWSVESIAYNQAAGGADQDYNVPIPISTNNLNLRDIFNQTFSNQSAAFADIVANNKPITFYPSSSNVVIGSTSTSSYSLEVGSWPSNLPAGTLILDFNFKPGVTGTIVAGRGGDGGDGENGNGYPDNNAENGKNGGDAIHAAYPIKLKGTATIGGGGGGGGGGIAVKGNSGIYFAGGGGGAGQGGGNGGSGGLTSSPYYPTGAVGRQAKSGQSSSIGFAGHGGDGAIETGTILLPGGRGKNGYQGSLLGYGQNQYFPTNGAAGRAVVGYSNVDDSAFTGTYYGAKVG